MEIQTILNILAIIFVFLALFDVWDLGEIFKGNTRETPHGPVFSSSKFRCNLHGGRRFYGLGGKCDEPLTWPDLFILGILLIFFYSILYK